MQAEAFDKLKTKLEGTPIALPPSLFSGLPDIRFTAQKRLKFMEEDTSTRLRAAVNDKTSEQMLKQPPPLYHSGNEV